MERRLFRVRQAASIRLPPHEVAGIGYPAPSDLVCGSRWQRRCNPIAL